jgi:hypothetical protein
MLQEQVRLLRRAAEMLVKQSHTKDTPNDLVSDKDRDNFESDVAELQEQIVKLKGILLSKSIIRIIKCNGKLFFCFSFALNQERANCHSTHCRQG